MTHELHKGCLHRLVFLCLLFVGIASNAWTEVYQLVYTSDQHYGITRKTFRGADTVSAREVNAAMVQSINTLTAAFLPDDGGVRGGETVEWVDTVISTGDIANRMEGTDERLVPSAAECWTMFEKQYIKGLTVKTRAGKASEIIAIPGNHDVTNAVGFYKAMMPKKDCSAVLAMYNRVNKRKLKAKQFDATRDKVRYRFGLDGVCLLFVEMWPDSDTRAWIDGEMRLTPNVPVLLFTHDQPNIEAKHLINPNGDGGINAKDKFENLVCDTSSVKSVKEIPVAEHRALASFIKEHPDIAAYFHGNENYNEFYTWGGVDDDIALPVFRVDSPMKGNLSSKDETLLSYQFICIDTDIHKMTVREVLWNAHPQSPDITWGESKTVDLRAE